MELIKVGLKARLKNLVYKIDSDNLFLLSSSVSYYSALALAPFLLIILWLASTIGEHIQGDIIERASVTFSPYVADLVRMVFQNVNEGVSIGSISGAIGLVVLLWTCSLVYIQFRYAFDVIYGHYDTQRSRPVKAIIFDRLFAMLVVVLTAVLLVISFMVATFFEYSFGAGIDTRTLVVLINFVLYLILFTCIHFFVPTRRPKFKNAVQISCLSAVFFILGNILVATYLKSFAGKSVYGAAGTLLVFLIWSYYSSFTLFLSVEVFQFLKRGKT